MNVSAISEFIAGVVMWGVVPLIILVILQYAWGITSRISDSQSRTSAIAGFWAGVVLSIMFMVSQVSVTSVPDFSIHDFPEFNLGITVVGVMFGFGLLWAVRSIVEKRGVVASRVLVASRVVGWITLLLSAASCSALFSYFFIDDHRGLVVFFSLGASFGALLNVVVIPRSVR